MKKSRERMNVCKYPLYQNIRNVHIRRQETYFTLQKLIYGPKLYMRYLKIILEKKLKTTSSDFDFQKSHKFTKKY